MMLIEDLLGKLTENSYSQFLAWALTVGGGIFGILKKLDKRSSDQNNLLDNETTAELYFSKALVTEEIAIWKGFHSSYPYLTQYASVISDKVKDNHEKDLPEVAKIISRELRHEEAQKLKGFDLAVEDLIGSSYNPLLERAKMQFEYSGDTKNVQNVEKLISKEFEDPDKWIRAEEEVLSGLRAWTPKCEIPKGMMKDIEKYLAARRDALDKCIRFGTRLLLARKFYDAASSSPETDHFANHRLRLWNTVPSYLSKESGDFVVTLSNNVIMELLDILLRHSS